MVGSVFANDSTTVVDGVSGAVNAAGGLTADLITPSGQNIKVQRVHRIPTIQLQATGTMTCQPKQVTEVNRLLEMM